MAADVAKSGTAPNTGADAVAGGAVTVQNNDRGGDEVEARDDEARGGGLDASTPSKASLDAKFCRESLGNELVYEAYRSQARYDKCGAAQKRGCKGKRARKRHRRKQCLRKFRSGGNAANIKAENKQATGSSSTKVKGRVSYIVGKAKTACFDATKVVDGRKSLAALLSVAWGVMGAVAATVAVAGATLAATACCWCGFICAAFVLHLAVVVATFGWASFQGSAAFDVLALVFAAAAPLGEASVEGLLGMLAALGPLRVLVGAALGGALYLAVLSSDLYQRAGIGCARLRGALVVSERRVFTCALALLAVGAASGWAPVLSWAAAVVDALAVVSKLRFCSGLRVVDALLIYLPLVCAAKTGGHHTRFVGTDGRASMLRLGCLAALVQPVASGSAKQLLPDVGAPYLIYSVFAVVMVAGVILWLCLRQVQSSGVVPLSQEDLVDGQAPILAIKVRHDATAACPDNGTPIVDGSSARDERRSWKKKLLTFLQGSSQSWMSSQSNDVVAASVFTGHSRRVRAVIINLHRSASVLRDPRLSDSVRVCNEIRGSDVGGVPRDVFRQGEALFSLASILERGLRSIHAAPTARRVSNTRSARAAGAAHPCRTIAQARDRNAPGRVRAINFCLLASYMPLAISAEQLCGLLAAKDWLQPRQQTHPARTRRKNTPIHACRATAACASASARPQMEATPCTSSTRRTAGSASSTRRGRRSGPTTRRR